MERQAFFFNSTEALMSLKRTLMSLIGGIHTDHLQWLANKTIDGIIIYEKTSKLA